MNKNNMAPAIFCVGASLLLAACGGGGDSVNESDPIQTRSAVTATGISFTDELLSFDSSRWSKSDWSNNDVFINSWRPSQITFLNGIMAIKLEADPDQLTGKPAVSGEYTTNTTYKYGLYKARFIAPKRAGTITALFTYTGPSDLTQHDEIDVEIKGDDTTKMQVNYWTAGVQHPTDINLGFDASTAYHDYAFRWTATGIQWYVDDILVHQETGSRGALPVTAGKIMLNHWGTIGTGTWSTDYVASAGTQSVMSVERVSFTAEPAIVPTVVSVATLTGKGALVTSGWTATATIKVKNASGVGVAGAVVTGGFTVGGSALTCTTASTGICSITSAKIATTTTSSKFSVTKISGTNMTYDATKNTIASVVIAKP